MIYKTKPSFSEDYHSYLTGGCFEWKRGQEWDRQRECQLGKENVKGWNKLEWQHILVVKIETPKPFLVLLEQVALHWNPSTSKNPWQILKFYADYSKFSNNKCPVYHHSKVKVRRASKAEGMIQKSFSHQGSLWQGKTEMARQKRQSNLSVQSWIRPYSFYISSYALHSVEVSFPTRSVLYAVL